MTAKGQMLQDPFLNTLFCCVILPSLKWFTNTLSQQSFLHAQSACNTKTNNLKPLPQLLRFKLRLCNNLPNK